MPPAAKKTTVRQRSSVEPTFTIRAGGSSVSSLNAVNAEVPRRRGELPVGAGALRAALLCRGLGTVEAWGRSPKNPVGGWYGLKKGLRGRFANYVPPVMKLLGLAEVEDKPRGNRMRAL